MTRDSNFKRRTSQETREAVLEAARRLFFTKGFDQTTLMDLGGETGLSARGVILHFETKADIIATLLIRDYSARRAPIVERPQGSTHAQRILDFYFWMAREDAATFIAFPALWSVSARWSIGVEAEMNAVLRRMREPVRQELTRGIAAGEFRGVDIQHADELIWQSYQHALRAVAVNGGMPALAVPQVFKTLEALSV
ncbi:TetR/AcrR family transcriptional regulator [Pseudoxanthomonas sp. SL93]|uniref:TetR/AcrR family transcriptional regulator n=1 Tax=Pseudoxanthomonas sp. SL93 TaxID=2995142 RepID=UPI0022716ADF|nr:TetR/AcrR family transcriptional regulator [Pseudoxanthomonas sp. SL93]WAC63853.1 TetR/AcrR family transcriptional regulator [Pseudoxanthomonas sp. SL93]